MFEGFPRQAGAVTTCAGTGYIALDIVIEHGTDAPRGAWAGGSCGNVLAILAYMGWRSCPIGRLGDDLAAELVMSDLSRWGTDTSQLRQSRGIDTPIVLEHVFPQMRQVDHRFSWHCPHCRARLPRFRPVLKSQVAEIGRELAGPSAFYFDRVSHGAVALAESLRDQGTLIVFEPSSAGQSDLFHAACRVADVIKYSRERIPDTLCHLDAPHALLEVQTLGGAGLRYRFNPSVAKARTWTHLEGVETAHVRDTTGAGDWCTAALIASIGGRGRRGLLTANEEDISLALQLGQAMAALNCQFEGARGLMYSASPDDLTRFVQVCMAQRKAPDLSASGKAQLHGDPMESLCPMCR